jgi:hypothetical protein
MATPSPDLATCYNSLWSNLKEKISELCLTNQDLKTAIRNSFFDIQPSAWQKMPERTWKRIKQCADNGGQHTNMLLQSDFFGHPVGTVYCGV